MTVSGQADDPSGVDRVTVRLFSFGAGEWLQDAGGTFGASAVDVDTALASPGAVSTTWSLGPLGPLAGGQYWMQNWSVDSFGNGAVSNARIFHIS